MADATATDPSILADQQAAAASNRRTAELNERRAELEVARLEREAAAAADRPSPQTPKEQLLGFKQGLELLYFTYMTDHSLADFDNADGEIPENMKLITQSAPDILPVLVQLGVTSEEEIESGINDAIDALEVEDVIAFLDGLQPDEFENLYNNNPSLQQAVITVMEQEVANMTIGELLVVAPQDLHVMRRDPNADGPGLQQISLEDSFKLPSGQPFNGQHLLDVSLGSMTEENLATLFGREDENGNFVQGHFSAQDIKNMITSMPGRAVQMAIYDLGGFDHETGEYMEGWKPIEIENLNDRDEVMRKFDEAVAQRAYLEIDKKDDLNWSEKKLAELSTYFNLASTAEIEVLQRAGMQFGQKLNEFNTEPKSINIEAAYFMLKGFDLETGEQTDESLARREAILTGNLDLIKDSLKKMDKMDNLTLFGNAMPNQMTQGLLDVLRNGGGFLGMIGKLVVGLFEMLGGHAPGFAKGLDIVTAHKDGQINDLAKQQSEFLNIPGNTVG